MFQNPSLCENSVTPSSECVLPVMRDTGGEMIPGWCCFKVFRNDSCIKVV